MAKRRTKKTVKKHSPSHKKDAKNADMVSQPVENELHEFGNCEVERRIAAIQAICDAEKQDLLTRLRLLRSFLSKQHLETVAVKFFDTNLPNISVIHNVEDGILELEWKTEPSKITGNCSEKNVLDPDSTSLVPDKSAFGFSSRTVEANFLQAASLQIPDFVLEEMSDSDVLGHPHALLTPGATSQRSSFGITPKTKRQPKNGEILLSIHGSPLGVYKEENMETIEESRES